VFYCGFEEVDELKLVFIFVSSCHLLVPLACSDSELTSEMNSFTHLVGLFRHQMAYTSTRQQNTPKKQDSKLQSQCSSGAKSYVS
jgi:hypothetical protein